MAQYNRNNWHHIPGIGGIMATGLSMGKTKTKKELSIYLLKRGLWLVFIELIIMSFGWFFDIHFGTLSFGVIWSLGISMVFLAGLIYLPRIYILIISLLIIGSHNLLDNIHYPGNIIWSLLHDRNTININESMRFGIGYPLIPWIAVMSLGYCFGSLYDSSFDVKKRKRILNNLGINIKNQTQVL
jgi:uncharacterized membrane protein